MADFYATLLSFFVSRDTLRAARFFGMILPAAFMIFDSAVRVAAVAATLSPESMALTAFFTKVLTALLRAVFTRFFFAVTRMRFFADLCVATFFPFIMVFLAVFYILFVEKSIKRRNL